MKEETTTFLLAAENYSEMIEIMEETDEFYQFRRLALIAFVSTLKGRKILVKGNHDTIKDLRYKQLYDEICDYK